MADENLDPGGGGADAGGEAPAETSLHDDISQAFEQVETRDAPPDSGKPDIPRPDAGEPARQPSGERARGPDGRFLEQQKPPEKPPAKAAQAPQAAPPKPPGAPGLKPALEAPIKPPGEPQLRAPASWRPAIREHWGKLPAEVQQEVVRREVEVGRALQESAHARQGLAAVQQVLAPYANNIQASGTDALTAMNNFFQADHTLRHGSMQEKAQLIANVIKNYGVDVQALDTVLAGQPFRRIPTRRSPISCGARWPRSCSPCRPTSSRCRAGARKRCSRSSTRPAARCSRSARMTSTNFSRTCATTWRTSWTSIP